MFCRFGEVTIFLSCNIFGLSSSITQHSSAGHIYVPIIFRWIYRTCRLHLRDVPEKIAGGSTRTFVLCNKIYVIISWVSFPPKPHWIIQNFCLFYVEWQFNILMLFLHFRFFWVQPHSFQVNSFYMHVQGHKCRLIGNSLQANL